MPQVLLFNIAPDKLRRIRPLLSRLGVGCRVVEPADFGRAIGALCGRGDHPDAGETADGVPAAESTFTGEMLIMDSLSPYQFSAMLEGLRRERAAVALKAVVTDSNLGWSAARLHRELSAEHEAMLRARASVHGGR